MYIISNERQWLRYKIIASLLSLTKMIWIESRIIESHSARSSGSPATSHSQWREDHILAWSARRMSINKMVCRKLSSYRCSRRLLRMSSSKLDRIYDPCRSATEIVPHAKAKCGLLFKICPVHVRPERLSNVVSDVKTSCKSPTHQI